MDIASLPSARVISVCPVDGKLEIILRVPVVIPPSADLNLTKRQLKQALGFTFDSEVVDFFGVTKAAVSAWAPDAPLPPARQWQAAALRPDLFGAGAHRMPKARKQKNHCAVPGGRKKAPSIDAMSETSASAEQ